MHTGRGTAVDCMGLVVCTGMRCAPNAAHDTRACIRMDCVPCVAVPQQQQQQQQLPAWPRTRTPAPTDSCSMSRGASALHA